MNAIETQDLSKSYRIGHRSVPVVDKLNLTVSKGIVFGYLGPNGAGKTTTIRMLCGVTRPSSGSATVAGIPLSKPDQVKAAIGYANQAASVYHDLSLEENLRFKASLYLPKSEIKGAVEEVLERFSLAEHRKVLAGQLSGGWRQRLLLGTAMVHRPSLIFLDEPTANVDPVGRRDLWDLIYSLSLDGVTVFVSTHYMEEAERCHQLAMIASGKILAQGKPEDLRKGTPGYFYRLEPDNLSDGLKAAKGIAEIRDAWISGNSVRISSERPLHELNLEGKKLEAVFPSLEDSFVHLASGGQLKEASL
ncbi:MAG: ABC transporter ATP-binding protein [Trueperaceae bacterium]|nr:ABC transporter ATP-binding protein [Trueperaceae bacterium]